MAIVPAIAQNFLDPLVVTAARIEQSASQVPYSTTVLDSEFLRESTRRTLPEALAYTPGILVQKTAHGQGSPFIRGFTGRQNLLLVDGVRLNNSTFRSGPVQYWNTVDPLSIDRIELIKSQGSVVYGSDAVGGTLNAFTKSSDFRSRTTDQIYLAGSAAFEFRSNGEGSQVGRLEMETGVGGQFGVWLGLSAKDFGDIEDSSVGRMKGTGYPEQDWDFRMDWALTPESTLTFASNRVNQDNVSRWHRTQNNPGWLDDGHLAVSGRWTADTYDQERSLNYLRYAGKNPQVGAAIQSWCATVSFQTVADNESQNRLPAEDSIRESHINLQTTGLDLSLESTIGPGTLLYGFDFYHDQVNSSGYKMKSSGASYQEVLPVADDSEYDLLGAYVQYAWKPVEAVEITTGTRYTHAEASLGRFRDRAGELQYDTSQDWNSAVGSLRGLFHVNPCWSVYGGLSQAFRAPNLDDLSGNITARAGNDSLGSASLDPEKFLTYELGVRHHSENRSLSLAAFFTDAKDLIVPIAVADGSANTIATNASTGTVYGIEIGGTWNIDPHWMLSGFAAWQNARTEAPIFIGGPTQDKPNSRQLPLTGSLALRWTADSQPYWIEARVLAATCEDRISAADQAADNQRIPTGGTPGYIVASLHAGWKINEHLDFNCGLENLTDVAYRNHGSGQNEPGWNGIFGVKLRW
jgi:hemoglobin/transferrin/lactoferrin receptor protein